MNAKGVNTTRWGSLGGTGYQDFIGILWELNELVTPSDSTWDVLSAVFVFAVGSHLGFLVGEWMMAVRISVVLEDQRSSSSRGAFILPGSVSGLWFEFTERCRFVAAVLFLHLFSTCLLSACLVPDCMCWTGGCLFPGKLTPKFDPAWSLELVIGTELAFPDLRTIDTSG